MKTKGVVKSKANKNPSMVLARTNKKKIVHGRLTGTGSWEKSASMRRDGLIDEFSKRKKTSVVVDSRIGERNRKLGEEDKIARRVAMEKKKQYKKRIDFNLPDDEEGLTHKGQAIANIERYDDPRDQSGSEDELLDKDFVGEAHFSGFLKLKPNQATAEPEEKSRKEIIEELISLNKAKKLEKAKQGDEYLNKVGSLNELFKAENVLELVRTVRTKKEELETLAQSKPSPAVEPPKLPLDPRDQAFGQLVRELKFEAKPARVEPKDPSTTPGPKAEIGEMVPAPKLINLPPQIHSTYEHYLEFLEQNDVQDPFKFLGANVALINLHIESHRGHLPKLCEYLFKLDFDLDTNASSVVSQKCFSDSILEIFHRIAEVSVDKVGLAEILLAKIREAQIAFDMCEMFGEPQMTVIFLALHLFNNVKLHRTVHSPVLAFVANVMSEWKPRNSEGAYRVLMLCHAANLVVQQNKRYMPEIVNGLNSVLSWAYDNNLDIGPLPCERYQLIITVSSLVKHFVNLYSHYPAAVQMFQSTRAILAKLHGHTFKFWTPEDFYTDFESSLDSLIETIDAITPELKTVRTKAALPKPLRLYEPMFDEQFTPKKRIGSRDKQNRDRINHKIKQEHKGAIRELKKDSACLARAQQLEQAQLDATRKRKVNLIMGSLSNQEGDYKKMRRGK